MATTKYKTDVSPYKVYTALLTQSGDGTSTQTEGPLVVGKTYEIVTFETGDDFTNVANVINGAINENGCIFIATGTTPTDYSNGSELRDTSAPVATVLENTLGNNIVWSRIILGRYFGTLPTTFPIDKTFIMIGGTNFGGNEGYAFAGYGSPDFVVVYSASGPNKYLDASDSILETTPIEIRVYN